jgi:hypothetical protein
MSSFKRFAMLAIGMLLLAGLLTAQQTTAKIFGVVQLEDGSLVPGVSVEATSPKLVGKEIAVTDENGAFRLVNLTPGLYKVVFSLQGFQTVVRENVALVAEQTINLKVQMKLGELQEAVTITGQVALIDVKSTAKGMTLTKEMFDVLPKGRNFDGLVAVIPGVVNENFLGGISIDGSSGGENMFYVDGQNTNSVYGGQGAQQAAFDFVDEVQIKASGYQAEFGGSLGGVINVVTRSGGNEFHGDVVGYYSGSALRGTERDTVILDPSSSKPILRQFNYSKDFDQALDDSRLEGGFGLGGYIIKDKLWFYANVMPVLRSTTTPSTYRFPSDPGHLASDPFNANGPIIHTYDFTQKDNDLNFQVKLSSQPFKNMRLSLGFVNNYNVFEGGLTAANTNRAPGRAGGSSDSYDWNALGYSYPNYSMNANVDYTLGNNFMVSARAGYFFLGMKNNLDPAEANTDREPLFTFLGSNATTIGILPQNIRTTGWQNQSSQAMTYPHEIDEESNLSAGADLTYFLNLAGEHAWKAGVAFTKASVTKNTLYNAPWIRLSWTGTRGGVEVRGGPTSRDSAEFGKQYGDFGQADSNRLALYLQDSWTIANKLTLNFGVRLESENVPSFNDDIADFADYIGQDVMKFKLLDKISPRVGFVYDVMGDSSLKVYGSYGIYNDVMELDMALGSFGGMRWVSDFYYLQADRVNEWMNIGRLLPNGSRDYSMLTYRYPVDYRYQSWGYVDPNLKPMAQSELTFGIEKKIGSDLSLSTRGTWRQLLRTIDDVGVQVPNDQGGFDEVYYIANPGYGWAAPVSQGGKFSDDFWPTPKAQRDYKALNFSLEKRMSNNWMGGVNLTLSRLYGNYTGIVSADEVNSQGTGFGRPDGNVTRYFDVWWMSYTQDGTKTQNNGLLATDRPVVLKAYGSYAFPFGLTVGGVFNFMSGTPKTTEWYVDRADGYYPLGRNDLGRSPNVWFLNLYAEYNLKLGKNTLQFSVNVDNATNNATATWYWTRINVTTPYIWWSDFADDNIPVITNGYDFRDWEGTYPQTVGKWLRDPRFNQAIGFQAPISARLGVKFIF